MPLATPLEMLAEAREGGYAVGAFNAENLEMVQAIVSAAEEALSPVMIQTTPGTLRHAGPEYFRAVAAAAAAAASVPVALHLDHGDSLASVARCLRAGYTSIMIDGSREPLEANIALTRAAAEVCLACGVPVEGELGRVGGKEDDLPSDACLYTDPEEAEIFVGRAGVTSLAVGVGTAHGVYKTEPRLNLALIGELRSRLPVPLVLHGASGLSDGVLRECVSLGIAKVNVATELRIAYTAAVRECLSADSGLFDPKAYAKKGRAAVKAAVLEKIRVLGSEGRAAAFR
ncbi:MAG: class II fructose-bisphosphate aldolase family protein [Deltaproteobacteria bacterium]|jgi:tagatose 1,6-diphosphate aldolase GatY/KbaY|nr:class II fructose-bisphosphate aldolase family protein [Deltaproteobacteria bacterium]